MNGPMNIAGVIPGSPCEETREEHEDNEQQKEGRKEGRNKGGAVSGDFAKIDATAEFSSLFLPSSAPLRSSFTPAGITPGAMDHELEANPI